MWRWATPACLSETTVLQFDRPAAAQSTYIHMWAVVTFLRCLTFQHLHVSLTPLCLQVDRPAATQSRCDAVASQLFDLFASLGADDRQLDFHVLYASSKQVGGWRGGCSIVTVGGPRGCVYVLRDGQGREAG
jgi:hypothetical protein